MGNKYFIQALPGTGKTYAAKKYPDKIADVDWGKVNKPNYDSTKTLCDYFDVSADML